MTSLGHGRIAGTAVGIALATLLLLGFLSILIRNRRKRTRTYFEQPVLIREVSESDLSLSEMQAHYYAYHELRGDLGGIEMRDGVEVAELSAHR